MVRLIQFMLTLPATSVRSRLSLQTENAALRNQLSLYREAGQRPSIAPAARPPWCFIAKLPSIRRAVVYFVQPRTVTAPASPWQNAHAERGIGTLRRELIDHVIVFNKWHLKRLLSSYLDYYHPWRTHRSLENEAPDGRTEREVEPCNVFEFSDVHALHHVYLPKAA